MKYTLQIPTDLTLEVLKKQIENGSRFVVFQYCISFALTFRRFSPAILIARNESIEPYQSKYNVLTVLFGWWGIPWEPI